MNPRSTLTDSRELRGIPAPAWWESGKAVASHPQHLYEGEPTMATDSRRSTKAIVALGATSVAMATLAFLAWSTLGPQGHLDCTVETNVDTERAVVESMPNCAP